MTTKKNVNVYKCPPYLVIYFVKNLFPFRSDADAVSVNFSLRSVGTFRKKKDSNVTLA